MVSFFMDTPVYSNPESNFLDRFGSSRVKSHNKSKYHSKSTSLNKNTYKITKSFEIYKKCI
ncbi:hypothetical protein HanPI659440_Chr17g0703421 [Helianthus annuus]|nr:hypothetical protein HanPI659440_Chr17g0703421 [Helianthus annuus]